jgi:hypothetical protein
VSVFKFTTIDEPLLAELEDVVKRGFDGYLGSAQGSDS